MHPNKNCAPQRQGSHQCCSYLVCCTAWCLLWLPNCAALLYVVGVITKTKTNFVVALGSTSHLLSTPCLFWLWEHERYVKLHFPNSDYVIPWFFGVRSCYVDLQGKKNPNQTKKHRKNLNPFPGSLSNLVLSNCLNILIRVIMF